jgi:FtsP/CotA-like multicopper oxidase with cupredoxin domain
MFRVSKFISLSVSLFSLFLHTITSCQGQLIQFGYNVGSPSPPGPYLPPPLPPKPREVFQSLIFSYGIQAPDNYIQTDTAILINGQFPGPPIRVRMYDTLIIEVVNQLDHGISLHCHGLRNYGSPEADGVPHVTQELIPPGTVFRYVLRIGFQSGTFLYHLHNGLDSVWAVGPLIIEDGVELLLPFKEYSYIFEYTFILSQCWHKSIKSLEQGILGIPFKDLPETDSILINGRSYGDWSAEEGKNGLSPGYDVISVKPGQTYRFRVIGIGADSILTFKIKGKIRPNMYILLPKIHFS